MMHPDKCPNCGTTWLGKDIADSFEECGQTRKQAEKNASNFGWAPDKQRRFSHNVVGVEIPGEYDGISYWKCLQCGCVYDTHWKLSTRMDGSRQVV